MLDSESNPPPNGGRSLHVGAYPLSRSPHPYHRRQLDRSSGTDSTDNPDSLSPPLVIPEVRSTVAAERTSDRSRHRWSRSPSDSGTEADDESHALLKGLPAPPVRPRKGLREAHGSDAESIISPLPTPSLLGENNRSFSVLFGGGASGGSEVTGDEKAEARRAATTIQKRRRGEFLRRVVELSLLLGIGFVVFRRSGASQKAFQWRTGMLECALLTDWETDGRLQKEIYVYVSLLSTLMLLYPIRLLIKTAKPGLAFWNNALGRIRVPSGFDPAPLMYPPLIPFIIALSLCPSTPKSLLANIILGISSLPAQLIPDGEQGGQYSSMHWLLAVVPLMAHDLKPSHISSQVPQASFKTASAEIRTHGETLIILYPLHLSLVKILQYLTTTSLLTAELQLLSIALINILLFSSSPQSQILNSLLWVGGLSVLVLCGEVFRWSLALARIPKWRFRRAGQVVRARNRFLGTLPISPKSLSSAFGPFSTQANISDSDADEDGPPGLGLKFRSNSANLKQVDLARLIYEGTANKLGGTTLSKDRTADDGHEMPAGHRRRHTLPASNPQLHTGPAPNKNVTSKYSRSKGSVVNAYLSLTPWEAASRKWLYAAYIYIVMLVIIFIGVRRVVAINALEGREPVGWAIGYLFGEVGMMRTLILQWGLESWIPLAQTTVNPPVRLRELGWIERIREDNLGLANTRLLLCFYCAAVLAAGLAVVLRLSTVFEVDTRRKVFHGIMVVMFLPVTFIDPTFASLALSLILAIFLLLDLLRASQLPPVSRPLANFLAPYVDGRDLRGPVVISHIFLLIGCAIPLWLSLAGHERLSVNPWIGWEVGSRDLGMVAGIVCVGMGDAAASLVGRRMGRHKWLWSGGKSIEGSAAFAVAVGLGLTFAHLWLSLGGWQGAGDDEWSRRLGKLCLASCGASLTEAVLTGGNDNVIVPVVLWLWIKGLDLR
ncbi:MAG: hypothetical protein M1825_000238 [Sarcosagium campestre]|nr:MAG: hypothetical protein M1825_000238 [Sarcosagium campestre]